MENFFSSSFQQKFIFQGFSLITLANSSKRVNFFPLRKKKLWKGEFYIDCKNEKQLSQHLTFESHVVKRGGRKSTIFCRRRILSTAPSQFSFNTTLACCRYVPSRKYSLTLNVINSPLSLEILLIVCSANSEVGA